MTKETRKKLKLLRRKCTRPFETAAIYFLLYFVKCFSLKGARRFSALLGYLFIAIPSVKKLVLANLDLAFPEKSLQEKKTIARQSQTNLIMVFIEFLWFYGREELMLKRTHIEEAGLQDFKAFRNAQEKPIIFLTMHLGNWEVISQSYQMIGDENLVCVARKIKNDALEHIMYTGRTALKVDIAHQEGAVRALMKNLKTKQAVGLLIDQNTKVKEGGVYGDFFGLPATITRSPATLAKKFNADICFIHGFRTKDGFRIKLSPLDEDLSDYSNDEDLSHLLLNKMESFIKEDPALWVWYYKRWDSCPASQSELLPKYPFYAKIDRKA